MAQHDSAAFAEAFGKALADKSPGIGNALKNAELQNAIEASVQKILEHVPSDKQDAKLGSSLGYVYGDAINTKILADLPKSKTEITSEALLAEINGALPRAERKGAKYVLRNIEIADTAKLGELKELAAISEEKLKTFTGKAKSFMRPVRQFFTTPLEEMRPIRVGGTVVAGIGLAGGALYLLTRPKETPEEKQSWSDRVTAADPQAQAASAQR